MNYLVTIIIPVYNGEKYLSETIESCLNQSFRDVAILLIDDFSTDSSRKIIQRYNEKYENVTAYYNARNLGIMRTIKDVESKLVGDAILFLGQDDLLVRDHLQIMMQKFSSSTSFIHCNCNIINENGVEIGLYKKEEELERFSDDAFQNLCFNNFISSCGLIINKQLYGKVGGFSIKFRNFGEWNLWIRLAACGEVKYCNQVRASYRRHHGNITNSIFSKTIKKRLEFIEYIVDCKEMAVRILRVEPFEPNIIKLFYEIIKLKLKATLYRFLLWVRF